MIELKESQKHQTATQSKLAEGSVLLTNQFARHISSKRKRKEQLKQFNYTFNNNINRIEEMERQPAYKRMGFELEGQQKNKLHQPCL